MDQDIKYIIVEDQDIVSLGLKISLESYSRLQLLGLAKDGEAAVDMALSLKPDLIIMDIGLPRLDGIEATRQICQAEPQIKILIMSSKDRPKDILASFAAGASGYVRKEATSKFVYAAMQATMEGQLVLEPPIAGRILAGWPDLQTSTALVAKDGNRFTFSAMELQIIARTADGLDNIAMARELDLSEDKLESEKRQLRQSLATLGSLLVAHDGQS